MDKGTAIQEALKADKEKYDRWFQAEVSTFVGHIRETSNSLQTAKKRLVELKYEPPEEIDLA